MGCNIVIDHQGKMPYWEGQSYGVIPPGTNPKNGKPYTNRLYSIASTRYGDDMKGTTTTLCVRRATYWCPELQAEDPAKKGICSNYLCDAKPGDEVKLTGPTGKVMLCPKATHPLISSWLPPEPASPLIDLSFVVFSLRRPLLVKPSKALLGYSSGWQTPTLSFTMLTGRRSSRSSLTISA